MGVSVYIYIYIYICMYVCMYVCVCARAHQQQLCMDTGCRLEDLLEAMDDRNEWLKRVREIHASDTT